MGNPNLRVPIYGEGKHFKTLLRHCRVFKIVIGGVLGVLDPISVLPILSDLPFIHYKTMVRAKILKHYDTRVFQTVVGGFSEVPYPIFLFLLSFRSVNMLRHTYRNMLRILEYVVLATVARLH